MARPSAAGAHRVLVNKTNDNNETATQQATEKQTTVRREAFTKEQLTQAWKHYIETHPNEQVVISTMLMSTPQKVNDTLYVIEVENQAQVQFMDDNKGKLMTFLRDEVKNDMLAIDVKISEKKSERRIWTPREVVDGIRKNNPKFDQFINDFQLGLA